MPGGDGTGPGGMGAMTGRGVGYCGGYSVPGYANPVAGRGGFFGRGRVAGFGRGMARGFGGGYGRGFGWGRGGFAAPAFSHANVPTMTKEQELDSLKGEAEYLTQSLEGIKKRIEDLESK